MAVLIVVIVAGSSAIFLKNKEFFLNIYQEEEEVLLDTINFYQWEGYIPEEVLLDFEEEYGIHVNLIEFHDEATSRSEFLNNPEKYDLFVAGDKLVDELISLNKIAKIDKEDISNFDNINSKFIGLNYDKDNVYSIPYAYGSTGIIYNSKLMNNVPEIKDFFNHKYYGENGMILDSDIYIYYLSTYIGLNGVPEFVGDYVRMNDFFEEQKKSTIFGNYEFIRDKLINEEFLFATNYESEYFIAIEDNPDLKYVIDEKSLFWIDSMVIPQNASNKEGAELLINYILRPDVSAKIVDYSYTLTPIDKAFNFVKNEVLISHRNNIENISFNLYSDYDENNLYLKFKEDLEKFFEGVENGN